MLLVERCYVPGTMTIKKAYAKILHFNLEDMPKKNCH